MVRECIVIVSYSFIINDEVCGFIQPSRRTCQDHLLSPYLFILCMNVLAQRVHIATTENKSSIGLKVCSSSEKISCLLFPNDNIFFCKSNLETCRKLNTLHYEFKTH